MKSILKILSFIALASIMAGCSTFHRDTTTTAQDVGQYTSDAMITSKIKTKFLNDLALKSFGISVSTRQGVVTLAGKLPNERLKAKAIRIAMNTKGVRAVDAQNLVTPRLMTVEKPKMHKKYKKAATKKAAAKTSSVTSSSTEATSTASPVHPIPPTASPASSQQE